MVKHHPRTIILRQLVADYRTSADEVARVLGRSVVTVRLWLKGTGNNVIPDHTLQLLQLKMQSWGDRA